MEVLDEPELEEVVLKEPTVMEALDEPVVGGGGAVTACSDGGVI